MNNNNFYIFWLHCGYVLTIKTTRFFYIHSNYTTHALNNQTSTSYSDLFDLVKLSLSTITFTIFWLHYNYVLTIKTTCYYNNHTSTSYSDFFDSVKLSLTRITFTIFWLHCNYVLTIKTICLFYIHSNYITNVLNNYTSTSY